MYSSVLLLHNLLLPLPKSYHGTRCTSKCKAFLSTFHPGGRRVKPEKKGLSPQLKNSNKQLHTLFPICPTGKLYASFSGLNLILQKPRQMAIERQLSVSARMVMFFFMQNFILLAQSVKNLPAMQETSVQFLGWEDPLEKEMATHSSCLENPMDRGAWQATVHRVTRDGHGIVTKPPPHSLEEVGNMEVGG